MIEHKGRLNQPGFHSGIKELLHLLAPVVLGLNRQPVRCNFLAQRRQGVRLLDVDPGLFKNCVAHRYPAPRRREVNLIPAERDFAGAQHLLRHSEIELFGQAHHVVIVCISLVHFEHGKLGVVPGGHTLIAKVVADFIHPVQAANDESLEVQLVGNPQEQIGSELVVKGHEGASRSATVDGLQHRGLHFQKAPLVEIAPNGRDKAGTHNERLAGPFVGQQVQVPLPVTHLDIGQAVPLLGQRAQGLGQQGPLANADSDLAGPRAEHGAGHADYVTKINQLDESVVAFLAYLILTDIDLYLAGSIHEVSKTGLAHHANRGQPSGCAHSHLARGVFSRACTSFCCSECLYHLQSTVSNVRPGRIGIDPRLAQ